MGIGLLVSVWGAGTVVWFNRRRWLSPALASLSLLALTGLALNFFGVSNWIMEETTAR